MIITIPGTPTPQARMRLSRWGVFDPCAFCKKNIREFLTKNFKSPLVENPHISFIFQMPIPVSTSKKVIAEMSRGTIRHRKKPDIDNLVKLYLDCLDGIVFEQDQTATLGMCIKLYHPEPKTIIHISQKDRSLQPFDILEILDAFHDVSECGISTSSELLSLLGFDAHGLQSL